MQGLEGHWKDLGLPLKDKGALGLKNVPGNKQEYCRVAPPGAGAREEGKEGVLVEGAEGRRPGGVPPYQEEVWPSRPGSELAAREAVCSVGRRQSTEAGAGAGGCERLNQQLISPRISCRRTAIWEWPIRSLYFILLDFLLYCLFGPVCPPSRILSYSWGQNLLSVQQESPLSESHLKSRAVGFTCISLLPPLEPSRLGATWTFTQGN